MLGAASACPSVARPRIGAISTRITAIIQSSQADPDETAAIFELLNNSQTEGSRSVAARLMDCTAVERQLADLEKISAPGVQDTAPGSPRPKSPSRGVPPLEPCAGSQPTRLFLAYPRRLRAPPGILGLQMRTGIETAFNAQNDDGGVNGRTLRLAAADDGYEPTRTAETIKDLYERERIFGFIGNVGTPTAVVAAPFALEHRMLFFGAFTGADILRREPPDRYVFNYRASYAEETAAAVNYLVKVRKIRTDQIAVFAQQDSYGDAGFNGVMAAMRTLRGGDGGYVLRLGYQRNTMDVDNALAQLKAYKAPIKAVVMVPTYRAAAKFIERTKDAYPGLIYTNVSFVGSTALKDELMMLGPQYAAGVIVTQVVPALDGYSSLVLQYKSALERYFPSEAPNYVSFEGYVAAQIMIEAVKRAGPQPDTERVVDALENMHGFDLGLGANINFGRSEHQGSHKVWGTQLTESGKYEPVDLQ